VLYAAFTAGIGLWAVFLVAYAVDGTHLRLFTTQPAVELVPKEIPPLGSRASGALNGALFRAGLAYNALVGAASAHLTSRCQAGG
jgi:hypothetical protein